MLLLRGKDETPDIEDLGSVLRDSSIQTLRLPTNYTICLIIKLEMRTYTKFPAYRSNHASELSKILRYIDICAIPRSLLMYSCLHYRQIM